MYSELLDGSDIFTISLRPGAEDKIALVVDLLKQSAVLNVKYAFMDYRPISIKMPSLEL